MSLDTNEDSVPSTFSSSAISYTVIVSGVTLVKKSHWKTSQINDLLENLAQHIFMHPGVAHFMLPEMNGLEVRNGTDGWKLSTRFQILISNVPKIYEDNFSTAFKGGLLLLL